MQVRYMHSGVVRTKQNVCAAGKGNEDQEKQNHECKEIRKLQHEHCQFLLKSRFGTESPPLESLHKAKSASLKCSRNELL